MKRKVTKMGPASLVVSLPSKWVKANKIKKGDEVEVTDTNKTLSISTAPLKHAGKKITLNVPTADKFLRRYLFSPYIQGVDEIRINYNEKKVFELVSEETNLLFGFEIVEQGSNYCIIKNIAAGLEEDFDIIFNRLFLSAKTMFDEVLIALKKNDFEALNNLSAMELNNNKLTYLCLRTINLQGYKDPSKTNSMYFIISETEQIIDDLREICLYTHKNKVQTSKTTQQIFECVSALFSQFYEIFKQFSTTAVFDFNQKTKHCRNLIINSKKQNKEEQIICHLYSILEKTSHIVKEIHY